MNKLKRLKLVATRMLGVPVVALANMYLADVVVAEKNAVVSSVAVGKPASSTLVTPDNYCSDMMDFYRQLANDPESELTHELRVLIASLSDDSSACEVRLQEIETAVAAYWATDPWCKREKGAFQTWLDTAVSTGTIPTHALTTVTELLSDPKASCQDVLYPAQGVIRFYMPEAFPQPEPTVDIAATSARSPVVTALEAARQSAKKKAKATRDREKSRKKRNNVKKCRR